MATDYTLSVKTDLPLVRVADIAFDLCEGKDPHLEEWDDGWQIFKFKVQYLDVDVYVNRPPTSQHPPTDPPWDSYNYDISFDVPFRLDNRETRDIVVDAARKVAKVFPMFFSHNGDVAICETSPDYPVVAYPTFYYSGPRALGDMEAMKFIQKELRIDPRKIR